jgi:hypothetical protein
VTVDFVGTLLCGIVTSIALGIYWASQGLQSEQVSRRVAENPLFHAVGVILGSLCSVLGGYVAGSSARRSELRLGALVGVGSSLLGIGSSTLLSGSAEVGRARAAPHRADDRLLDGAYLATLSRARPLPGTRA